MILLDTKLMRPRLPDQVIERATLLASLDVASTRALTLVSAPPGYGKTTIVCQWLERQQATHVWLSLDRHDDYPLAFWAAICSALGAHAARLFDRTWPHFNTLGAAPGGIDINAALTILIKELVDYSRTWNAPRRLMLVLDDFHVIQNADLLRQFSYFLDYCPDFLHCLIITRHDPALDLPRRRVRDQLREIRTADLRFDLVSADQFLIQRMGVSLPKNFLCTLLDKTEGWIAALQLFGMSMACSGGIGQSDGLRLLSEFRGQHQLLSDYLLAEVFNREDQAMQEFLRVVADYSRFSADLCDVLRDADNSADLIEQVKQRNLLIQPLDRHGQWYRLHDLFRDWLLSQPADAGRHVRSQRAALWFADQQLWQEALGEWLMLEEWERAAEIVSMALAGWLRDGTALAACHWVQQFPAVWLSRDPGLASLSAIGHFNQGRYAAAGNCLDQAMAGLHSDTRGKPALLPLIALLRSHLDFYAGRVSEIDHAISAVSADPDQSGVLSGWALQGAGINYFIRGEVDRGAESLLSAMQIAAQQRDKFCQLSTLMWLVPALLRRGDLTLAWHWIDTCEATLGDRWRAYPQAYTLPYLRALVLQEQNQLDAAWQALEIAFSLGSDQISVIHQIYLLFIRWRLCLQRGLLAEAALVVEQISLVHSRSHDVTISVSTSSWPYVIPGIDCLRAITRLYQGDMSALIRWSLATDLGDIRALDGETPLLRRLIEHLLWIRGRLLLQQDISDTLSAARDMANARGDRLQLLQCWLIDASAHYARGDTKAAIAAMAQALTLSAGAGFTRTFADEGPLIPALLQHCLQQPLVAEEAKRLMAELDWAPPDSPPAVDAATTLPQAESLSQREREVLDLLHSGRSNQQLAAALGITPATVKTHLHHIYGKLGATNRTQALAQARRLGLLG